MGQATSRWVVACQPGGLISLERSGLSAQPAAYCAEGTCMQGAFNLQDTTNGFRYCSALMVLDTVALLLHKSGLKSRSNLVQYNCLNEQATAGATNIT
jgi:hypothetical protein